MRPEKNRAAEVLDAPGAAQEVTTSKANHTGNTLEAQRSRALDWLKRFGSATTIELRRDCDIMMPAARIHELRHKFGCNITTLWTHQQTDCGKLHRVARYVIGSSQPSQLDAGV